MAKTTLYEKGLSLSILTEVSVSKPSKALNIVYLIFGYVVASTILPVRYDTLEHVSIIITVGSIIGTFLFYIKPIERVLFVIFTMWQKQISGGGSLFGDLKQVEATMTPIYLTAGDVFNSPMIAYDKMKINGAIFFSVSILASGSALNLIGLPQPQIYFVLLSLPTFIVACWEGHVLWKKVNVLLFFYDFMRSREPSEVTNALKKAVEGEDWLEASIIITNRYSLRAAFGEGGLCLKCQTMKSRGSNCDVCGKRLLGTCPNCRAKLVGMESFPKYCPFCGKSIPKTLQ
jgi:hypothetical protein